VPDPICARFFVSGKVQGVFFRASCVQQGARLGLQGWARNLADGRVEVLARGEPDAIAALGRWLAKGPPAARVQNVERHTEDLAVAARLADFRVA
jgi:acylphosphatase